MKTNITVMVLAACGLLVVAIGFAALQERDAGVQIMVYKSATCGCCNHWMEHMEQAGFVVEARDERDMAAVKNQMGVPRHVASCHTALVEGYIVEGHVPATYVSSMLKHRPNIKGVAVPGMPIGSPGMEGPHPQPYDVVTFDAKGQTSVYAHVSP